MDLDGELKHNWLTDDPKPFVQKSFTAEISFFFFFFIMAVVFISHLKHLNGA